MPRFMGEQKIRDQRLKRGMIIFTMALIVGIWIFLTHSRILETVRSASEQIGVFKTRAVEVREQAQSSSETSP